ncbi:MAG: lysylphosphatidylglycerol synthase transmembrane domain-containing protein, partial [candidate division Zixibacteria bacterium]
MANNVLPLRMGEFVRAYSLSGQDSEVSKSASLATIFVERMVFDLVALLGIFGAVTLLSQLPLDQSETGQKLQMGTYLAGGVAGFGLMFVAYMTVRPQQAGGLLVKLLFFLPMSLKEKVREIVGKFSHGLLFLKDHRKTAIVAANTLLIWIAMGLSNYFVFLAFDFALPLSASYVLLAVVSISILIPSSPGFVGVYHAGVAFTLQMYGVPLEAAGAFALVLHAAQYIPVTGMGFYFLKTKHLSLKKLEAEAADSN